MAKPLLWLKNHLPTQRRLIQLYAALLHNAHVKGFLQGSIYTGPVKMVCVPGLNCYSCPGAVGACPLGSLQNALAASGNRAPTYVIGILMLFGLTLGRTVCGFLCPMGLLQELIHKIPTPKIKKGRITRALSWLKYLILAVFVVIVPLWYALQSHPLPAFCKYICPAGTLEGAVALLSHSGNGNLFGLLGALFTRKFLILLLVIAACLFLHRAFCRFLCPLGALYGLFARFALIGVQVDAPKCTDCGRCVGICKMDIRRVGDHECIHCGQCIDACPTGAISMKAGKIILRGPEISPPPPAGRKQSRRRKTAAWIAALAVLVLALLAFNRPEKPADPPAEDPPQSVTDPLPASPAVPEPSDAPAASDTPDLPVGAEVGMLAPDFTVNVYGGVPFRLSDRRGTVTVINFWATWCTPCCAELPHFDRVAQEYGDLVEVIAIHSNLVTDDVQAYLDLYDYRIPFGQDETGSVVESFGGSLMLPHTVIVDRQGVIVYNRTGSLTHEQLTALLTEAGLNP